MAELKFRPDVVVSAIAGEADRQSAGLDFLLGLMPDKDVVAHDPVAFGINDVFVEVGAIPVFHHVFQDAPAAVVIFRMIKIDDALTLHVGLACEQEDTKFVGVIEVLVEKRVAGVECGFVENGKEVAGALYDVQVCLDSRLFERPMQGGRAGVAHGRMGFHRHEHIC